MSKVNKKTTLRKLLQQIPREEILALLEGPDLELDTDEEIYSTNYSCKDCKNKFTSLKKKRTCPKCKSKNISLVKPKKPRKSKKESKDEDSNFIHRTGINVNKVKSFEHQDGQRQARSEPVNLKKIKKIKKIDTGLHKKDSIEFDRKVKFNKTPRDRPEFRLTKIICSSCHKEYGINPTLLVARDKDFWECTKCLSTKRSR